MTELRPLFTLNESLIRPEAQGLGGRPQQLSGDSTTVTRVEEQEWNQHAARYLALGATPSETAVACGVHINTIYGLTNTPWFQERVTRLMADLDVDIMSQFKGLRTAAVLKLGELAATAKSEVVQLSAVKEILDRNFGKSVQRVEADTTVRSADPVAEVAALQRDIANLTGIPEAELQRQG